MTRAHLIAQSLGSFVGGFLGVWIYYRVSRWRERRRIDRIYRQAQITDEWPPDPYDGTSIILGTNWYSEPKHHAIDWGKTRDDYTSLPYGKPVRYSRWAMLKDWIAVKFTNWLCK